MVQRDEARLNYSYSCDVHHALAVNSCKVLNALHSYPVFAMNDTFSRFIVTQGRRSVRGTAGSVWDSGLPHSSGNSSLRRPTKNPT
jgi:hypothetical protein